jgi:hypothetical protein
MGHRVPDHHSAHADRRQTPALAQAPAAGGPEGLLRLLAAATFPIFFQAFMIARSFLPWDVPSRPAPAPSPSRCPPT